MPTVYIPELGFEMETARIEIMSEEVAVSNAYMRDATSWRERSDDVIYEMRDRLRKLQYVVEDSKTAFNQSAAEQRLRAMEDKARLAEIDVLKKDIELQERATAKQAELVDHERKIVEKERARMIVSDEMDKEKSYLNWFLFAIFGLYVFQGRLKFK